MGKAFTILIIDDDIDDRDIFCEVIHEIQPAATCLTAVDGIDGLTKLKAKGSVKPDIIFMDINMPRLNGKACMLQIKRDPALKHIPIVIYTTSKLMQDILDYKCLKNCEFLSKPAIAKDIRKNVQNMIEKLLPQKLIYGSKQNSPEVN